MPSDIPKCIYMRPEMKFPRNEISFCQEKSSVYINFHCGRVVGVKRPIKKCKQTRARYRAKHVGGNDAGIY